MFSEHCSNIISETLQPSYNISNTLLNILIRYDNVCWAGCAHVLTCLTACLILLPDIVLEKYEGGNIKLYT